MIDNKYSAKISAKNKAMHYSIKALTDQGYRIESGVKFGMKKGSVFVVAIDGTDVQIRFITPRPGLVHYPMDPSWENKKHPWGKD